MWEKLDECLVLRMIGTSLDFPARSRERPKPVAPRGYHFISPVTGMYHVAHWLHFSVFPFHPSHISMMSVLVKAYGDCQLEMISSFIGMSARTWPEQLNWRGKTPPHRGQHHFMEKVSGVPASILSASWLQIQCSWPPSTFSTTLSCHDGLYSQTLSWNKLFLH